MKQYWECHVTMEATPPGITARDIKSAVEDVGWGFSAIDEDLILGPGVKCYATHHYNKKVPIGQVYKKLKRAAQHLHSVGIRILRVKNEAVIYDARLGRDF